MNAFEVGLNKIPDGLIGVRLKKGTGSGKATVVTVCGGEDVTADYGDKWAAELFLNESGEAPTSATFDAGTGLITFDPVASYRVASASVLAGADIDGLEGVDELVSLT